jgi:hypothetical protein
MKPVKLLSLQYKYSYPNNGDDIVNDIHGYVPGDATNESQHENMRRRENGMLAEIEEDDETKLRHATEDKDEEKDEDYGEYVNPDDPEGRENDEDDEFMLNIEKHRHNKKKDVFEPHPFYQSLYGYTGFEGAYTSPMEYYSGSIAEEPGAITNNPYNNPYQSSATASSIERIKIRAMIFNDMLNTE